MTEKVTPHLVIEPAAQAVIDANPDLAKAMKGFKEAALNAMQGVEDGRYKSFDDAMEAMTGNRPERIEPPHPPKYGYYLGIGKAPDGTLLAAITDGNPHAGDEDVEVMCIKQVQTEEEAREWFNETTPTLPWREEE